MVTGFTYKGIHSSTMGVRLQTKSRPILPEVRQSLLTIPSADGSLDYSAATEFGRAMYEDRIFTVVLYVGAKDIADLQCKVSKIAVWLMGSGELVFDDMAEAVWDASVLSEIEFAPERQGRRALLTVNFRVKPFSHASFDVFDGVTLDSDVHLGAMLPLDFHLQTSYTFTGTSYEMQFVNCGNVPVRAKFLITPQTSAPKSIKLVCNGRSIALEHMLLRAGSPITVDNERCVIEQEINDSAVNFSGYATGRFFELEPGNNLVKFIGGAGQKYTVAVSYQPQFVYNAEFGEV